MPVDLSSLMSQMTMTSSTVPANPARLGIPPMNGLHSIGGAAAGVSGTSATSSDSDSLVQFLHYVSQIDPAVLASQSILGQDTLQYLASYGGTRGGSKVLRQT